MTAASRTGGSALRSVGASIAISSLIGYSLLALVTRMLSTNGTSDFGRFSSYWGVLFGIASSLAMVEQEAARQSAELDLTESAPIRRVAVAAAVIATAFAAVTLLPPVATLLYGTSDMWPGFLVLLATLGFTVQFMIRGLLVGAGQVRSYSGLVVAEAATRMLVLLVVWATIGVTLGTAAAAVAAGSYAWIGWCHHARRVPTGALAHIEKPQSWAIPFRRAGSLMLSAGLTACIITGYTAMVTAFSGGTTGDDGGIIFAAVQASRVPLLFVAPIQALAVPTIVRWRQDEDLAGSRIHRFLLRGVLATMLAALVCASAAWLVGPWAVQFVFGPKYIVSPVAVAGLVFSACFLALLQLMSAALVASGEYRSVTGVWALATGATALWLFLSPFGVVGSTVIGTLVGPTVGVAFALFVLWRLATMASSPTLPH